MATTKKTTIALAAGAALTASMALTPLSASAEANPFASNELSSGYMQLAEAKCGANKAAEEAKCGANKKAEQAEKMKEGKCGANKMDEKAKEGKCGANKNVEKAKEGKCGEAKCGANKNK